MITLEILEFIEIYRVLPHFEFCFYII
jgi:hypothetical protein